MSSDQGDAQLGKVAASSTPAAEEDHGRTSLAEAAPQDASTNAPDATMESVATAPTATSSATADENVPPDTSVSTSASQARMQSALAALMQVLDSDDVATATTSLRSVQKMCMRVPHLSDVLTRPQRLRLYTLLLLEDGNDGKTVLPESWTAYTEKALETHIAVAQQAAALFSPSLHITVDELAGLFYHLGAETAFYFNPEMIDVVLCVTYVVAGGRSTDKNTLLRILYQLLCVLQKDFLVSTASRLYEPATTALLRLTLQFYDPTLATHMDQQQVEVGSFVLEWSRRLLVLHADYETALKVLDWVLILGDPVMIPYVAQAYLITHRQHLLSLQTKQELTVCLREVRFVLPGSKSEAVDPKLVDGRATALMPVWSGKSLLQNADLLYRVTPLSTQRMLDFCLYPDVGTLNKTPEDLQQYYANTPCLPLERSDLASAFAKRGRSSTDEREAEAELPSREYIIVDCRSAASFNYVRLPTAILVGDVLSYQQEELEEAMRRLESCRGRALALFGTGRPIVEEVNLLKVLALFLINKKAFPFVCIVPGGFKTTIPLLRNRVIDAVLSPAAAASLDSTATSTGVNWGQQASNTAHNISAKLSEISELLPHVETAEVRQKAEEFGSKAKESVAAAGTWGWGMMQRLREGLSETREHASSVLSSVATKVNSAQAATAAGAGADGVASSTFAGAQTRSSMTQVAAAAHPSSQPPQQQQQIFSLGEVGEEDDLDLITSIPTRPMRGTVVNTPQPLSTTTATTAPAPSIPTATVVTATVVDGTPANGSSSPPVADVVSTPDREPQAQAGSTDAVASSKTEPPAAVSPVTVPPSTGAGKPASAGAVPRVSASQIAANIDAEFDELFGELNTSPLPTTRSSASPTKPSAAINEDDLFGA
ncbi:hypothetical protein ABB37_02737 [Leptomonas pyrrhocoris]|uniref:TBC1 domain family member 23 n=1 Tax=Leptomonas pyrrhocoris TaxID=157538 RepID=A0A0N0VG82_LEPPY|nr:hypothetical protein ABB37_02737 [Leptomonas pyrrhocoris]KPA83004.1 hypothetical protein ABB37_02737 [Leptomonas pyrrhocoris]|eukprot:XP_015661443.1 hypothetical protein ABB37_02737 [Leptomonas pyrrhocoris]